MADDLLIKPNNMDIPSQDMIWNINPLPPNFSDTDMTLLNAEHVKNLVRNLINGGYRKTLGSIYVYKSQIFGGYIDPETQIPSEPVEGDIAEVCFCMETNRFYWWNEVAEEWQDKILNESTNLVAPGTDLDTLIVDGLYVGKNVTSTIGLPKEIVASNNFVFLEVKQIEFNDANNNPQKVILQEAMFCREVLGGYQAVNAGYVRTFSAVQPVLPEVDIYGSGWIYKNFATDVKFQDFGESVVNINDLKTEGRYAGKFLSIQPIGSRPPIEESETFDFWTLSVTHFPGNYERGKLQTYYPVASEGGVVAGDQIFYRFWQVDRWSGWHSQPTELELQVVKDEVQELKDYKENNILFDNVPTIGHNQKVSPAPVGMQNYAVTSDGIARSESELRFAINDDFAGQIVEWGTEWDIFAMDCSFVGNMVSFNGINLTTANIGDYGYVMYGGIEWKVGQRFNSMISSGLIVNGDVVNLMIVDSTGLHFYFSDDGMNWEEIIVESPLAESYDQIIYGDGEFLITGFDGTNIIYATSSNLETWVENSFESPERFVSICFDGNIYVGVREDGVVMSLNGTAANSWQVEGTFVGASFNKIIFDNGNYILVGNSGVIKIATVLGTWTELVIGVENIIDVYGTDTQYVAITAEAILYTLNKDNILTDGDWHTVSKDSSFLGDYARLGVGSGTIVFTNDGETGSMSYVSAGG